MSTNKEHDTNQSTTFLFLRVCYRHKTKLRSFECLPSFPQLIDQIIHLYPTTKSKLVSSSNPSKATSSSSNESNHNNTESSNHNKEEKSNRKQHKWRLQTNDGDWIETEHDWNTMIQYLKEINRRETHPNENDSSSNPIHLTLQLMIDDEADNTTYNPELPSFQNCYKNPLTLIYQRPPPPPYKPPVRPAQNPAGYGANPYAAAPPYYPPYNAPVPPTQYHPNGPYTQPPPNIPHPNHAIIPAKRPNHAIEPMMGSNPIKKRKLNEENTIAVPTVSNSASTPMPSGPPPSELLDANPYGIVHMNGYVWCDACNRWFQILCFDSHLQGKKHRKNIEAFSFRKVLKHWQNIRTKVVDDVSKCNLKELSVDNNLWYAQICLSCLSEVHYSSWEQHVTGQVHQNNFAKCPRKVCVHRQIPPGNEGCNDIPTLFSEKYFSQISNYVPGSKILILGEQDFSYSLAVCGILQSGLNLVGTSYLGAFDPNSMEPEEHPADDGLRANYFRNTLPSHDGRLQQNLHLLSSYRAHIAHDIDATKLFESLTNTNPKVYCGPFDIIVFPFPRASLKRGLDFRNSTLIQGFFYEIRMRRSELLYPLSQIQMIVLDNQFKEWDVANIAKENGWTLKWRCSINFSSLPQYQPRELSGKAWNPKTARLLVFLWDTDFDKTVEGPLDALNSINDLALLPDEAMKVTKQAKMMDAYHAQGIRQYHDPSLTRLAAPPSSLQR
eukprot:164717_1